MDLVYEKIWEALGYLFIFVFVHYAWKETIKLGAKSGWKAALSKGLGFCFVVAIVGALLLGNASCEETSDPVYGGCEQYADDGYEPTTEQRLARFAYLMILFGVPVAVGAYQSRDENLDSD